jgi:hypothetical protein
VTFNLKGGLASNKVLHLWYTYYDADESKEVYFKQMPDIQVTNGQFTLNVDLDSLYTVTTTTGQVKGSYPPSPPPAAFPMPYSDDFQGYEVESEAKYFADQTGTWSVYQNAQLGRKTMRQVVTIKPIAWCGEAAYPITLIGDRSYANYNVTSSVFIEGSGRVSLGGRVGKAGCGDIYAAGYSLNLDSTNSQWTLTANSKSLATGTGISGNRWYAVSIAFDRQTISGTLDGRSIFSVNDATFSSGWASLGSGWNYAQFDKFSLRATAADVLADPDQPLL